MEYRISNIEFRMNMVFAANAAIPNSNFQLPTSEMRGAKR